MNQKTIISGIPIIILILLLISITSFKTYENDMFSVKYPGSWKMLESEDVSGKVFYTPSKKTSCTAYGFSNSEEFKAENTEEFINTLYPSESEVEIIDRREVLLSEQPAIEIYSKYKESYQHAAYLIDGDLGYGIYCVYESLGEKEKNSVMFHKMLNSFKLKI